MNTIIDVDGDTATGKWRLIMPCTVMNEDGVAEARWLLSAYDERYVRFDAQLMYQSLIVDPQFYATHADGWAAPTDSQT